MREKVFKKEITNSAKISRQVSTLFKDTYCSTDKNVIKNYILEPNKKLIDCF